MKPYNTYSSRKMNEELSKILPGGLHSNYLHGESRLNLHISHAASSSRITDVDGNEYLDMYNKSGSVFLGHKHKAFNDYLVEGIEQGFGFDLSQKDLRVCEYLKKHIPSCEMARFGLSASEIIQNALRLARSFTGREKVIRFNGHFHGTSDSIFTDSQNILTMEWNDLPDLTQMIKHKHSDKIAAVIMEPVCLNGGGMRAADGYLEGVKALCLREGVVLIIDETITGIRTGLGGMQRELGIKPDISIFGKGLGNGVPVSVMAGSKDILSLYGERKVVHGGTHNGYTLGMAAIEAVFDIIEADIGRYAENESMNGKICEIIEKEAEKHSLDITLQGTLNCIVLNASERPLLNQGMNTRETRGRNLIIKECLMRHGILAASMCRFYPNFYFGENDLDFLGSRLPGAFREASVYIRRVS